MGVVNTTLDDIAAIIGFSATLELSAWYSTGSTMYVPAECKDGQLLVKLIGFSAAKRLSEEWPNELVAIPRLANYERGQQRRLICRMVEQKFGTREISRALRLSEKRVLQIVRELEANALIEPVAPLEKPQAIQPEEIEEENA